MELIRRGMTAQDAFVTLSVTSIIHIPLRDESNGENALQSHVTHELQKQRLSWKSAFHFVKMQDTLYFSLLTFARSLYSEKYISKYIIS